MRSINQVQLKQELHQELRIRYREFFESTFAVALLSHPEQFPSVKKISKAILTFITAHEEKVIERITKDPTISIALHEPYFGACYDSKEEVRPTQIVEKMLTILKDEDADLKEILQIQGVFIHKIYDYLERKAEKSDLVSNIFPDSFFNPMIRNRIEINKNALKTTRQLGISRHKVFEKMVGNSNRPHTCARDKFTLNPQSYFFKTMTEKEIPVVSGPSGHMGSFILGVKLYGDLTCEEFNEYVLACFAFLAAGGNHSYYEVMMIANRVNHTISPDNYSSSISDALKDTDLYKKLSEKFPEFFEKDQPHYSFTNA